MRYQAPFPGMVGFDGGREDGRCLGDEGVVETRLEQSRATVPIDERDNVGVIDGDVLP